MKYIAIFFLIISALFSCKQSSNTEEKIDTNTEDSFLKLSLAQWSLNREIRGGDMSPFQFAEEAKKLGFDGVEYVSQLYTPILMGENYTKMSMDELVAEMKSKSLEHGIENVLIMIDHEGDLASTNVDDRHQAVDKHKKWVDAAKELGCHSVRVNLFGADDEEVWKESSIDGLSKLSEYASTKGINVIVENHGGFSSNAKLLMEVINAVDMPNCGTLPDFGNFCMKREGGERWGTPCIEEYDIYKGVKELMPKAFAVSAKSYEFDEQGNETKIDYYKILQSVKDAGYKGYIGVEFEGEADSQEGILATRELILKAVNKLK